MLASLLLCLVQSDAPRPNVVVILADDMGYSDLGCYGGEIATPNLDALAAGGLRYTQFFNTARCCPTRASLLTGRYAHQVGIGHMTSEGKGQGSDKGWPGYRGFLSPDSATIAEVLGDAGYRTFMSGKWHVGTYEGMGPLDRGFERFYGILRGASNYWRPAADKRLSLDDRAIEPPEDFYATDAFSDHAIRWVEQAELTDDTPFLLYLAYTSPHWPLHAPAEDIARYRGRYTEGWDPVRAARLERLVELELVEPSWELSARDARAWDEISDEQKDELDLRMAIYAAQIDRMDQGVGRLVARLEQLGELEDTLILFLIDNGGCAEGGELGGGPADQLGTQEGYWLTYGRAWANASNTPFREYKHWVHEGGISTPLIAHWPAGISARGELRRDPGHLIDLMATFVELSGAEHDSEQMEGVSLVPTFGGEALAERSIFFEHEGNKAVRRGKWKLVSRHGRGWELYDLEADRTETRDLAGEQADIAAELEGLYGAWARRCDVRPWPVQPPPNYEPPALTLPPTWKDLAKDEESGAVAR